MLVAMLAARKKCEQRWRKQTLTMETKNKLMKSIITMPAITVLAALTLAGCDQNTGSNSSDTQSTNSSTGAITNLPTTNNVPDMNTNLPATNSLAGLNANMPTGTN